MKGEGSVSPAETEKLIETCEETERQLWELLESQNYAGPVMDLLQVHLYRYATPILRGKILSRAMYDEVAERRRPVPHDPANGPSSDDVDDLVAETIERAIRTLLRNARKGAGWDPNRGTRLTTYFIALCVGEFSNVYKKWFDGSRQTEAPTARIEQVCDQTTHADNAPEMGLAALDAVEEICPGATNRERKVLFLIALGHTLRDSADQLGLTYKSVESLIHRLRRRYGRNGYGGTNER